jgi:hypothetical protein
MRFRTASLGMLLLCQHPKRLEIALIDPEYKPEYICIDNCVPEDLKKLSQLHFGTAIENLGYLNVKTPIMPPLCSERNY